MNLAQQNGKQVKALVAMSQAAYLSNARNPELGRTPAELPTAVFSFAKPAMWQACLAMFTIAAIAIWASNGT